MKQAVIFDLDGLMIRSEGIASIVWNEVLERHGQFLEGEDYRRLIGLAPMDTVQWIIKNKSLTLEPDQLIEDYWSIRTERVIEQAELQSNLFKILDEIQALGLKTGIASNSIRTYVLRVAESKGLTPYFEVMLGVDDVNQGKPFPDIYILAASRLEVSPGKCLVFEDSLVGLKSALSAGMRCVVIPHEDLNYEDFSGAYAIFNSLEKVQEQLASLLND
jgi:putative hydrolase of the HAD superfamily